MKQSKTHHVAVIAGDGRLTALSAGNECSTDTSGIGIEVTAATLKLLKSVQEVVGGFQIETKELDYGSTSPHTENCQR